MTFDSPQCRAMRLPGTVWHSCESTLDNCVNSSACRNSGKENVYLQSQHRRGEFSDL